jgi:hypothetical protein
METFSQVVKQPEREDNNSLPSSDNMILYFLSRFRGCIEKFPDWVDNEVNNNELSLRSNANGYGYKTH